MHRKEGEFRLLAAQMEPDLDLCLPFGCPKTAPFLVDKAARAMTGGFVACHDRWVMNSGVTARSTLCMNTKS